jgi:hypothetical protein
VTTVIWKGGLVASDSAITDDSDKNIGTIPKIFRLEHGHVFASCGDGDDRELRKLLHHIKSPDEIPLVSELKKLESDIEAIIVFKTGEVWDICTGENAGAFPVDEPHFAIGSGRLCATAALDAFDRVPSDWTMERKVRAALQIAIDRDIYSRGPVRIVRL